MKTDRKSIKKNCGIRMKACYNNNNGANAPMCRTGISPVA